MTKFDESFKEAVHNRSGFIDLYHTGGLVTPKLTDLYPHRIIPTDYVIPRAMLEQMESREESWVPEMVAREAENRIKVEKIVTSYIAVDVISTPSAPVTGDRMQMLADIDAVELTPASKFEIISAAMRKRISEKIKRNMEYGFLSAARGRAFDGWI